MGGWLSLKKIPVGASAISHFLQIARVFGTRPITGRLKALDAWGDSPAKAPRRTEMAR